MRKDCAVLIVDIVRQFAFARINKELLKALYFVVENISPMFMRNFPPSFWKSQHPGEVYECPTDPWHPHYPQYHHR